MKKYLVLMLALLLTLSLPLFASAAELEEITILYPGEETDEMASFLNGPFAERVAKELNLKVNFTWLSWSDYWDQKTLKLAANEPVDLYWDGLSNLPAIVNRKEAQPLDELIAKIWGEDLKAVMPDSQLAGGKVKGQTFGIRYIHKSVCDNVGSYTAEVKSLTAACYGYGYLVYLSRCQNKNHIGRRLL